MTDSSITDINHRAEHALCVIFDAPTTQNPLKFAWRLITGNWFYPGIMNTQAATRKLQKQGFSDSEIHAIRKALYHGIGDMIVEYGEEETSSRDEYNFTGWCLNISTHLKNTQDQYHDRVKHSVLNYLKQFMSQQEIIHKNG